MAPSRVTCRRFGRPVAVAVPMPLAVSGALAVAVGPPLRRLRAAPAVSCLLQPTCLAVQLSCCGRAGLWFEGLRAISWPPTGAASPAPQVSANTNGTLTKLQAAAAQLDILAGQNCHA